MRTVFKIFGDDIRQLCSRFFVLAVIVAISVLPALYAWVNIYANTNPYANTGQIKIALASNDPGIDMEDGTHVNMAEEVMDETKKNDKIGWQFPKTATDAINGVKTGEYYAAIIFEDNFTYNMYNFEQALLDKKAPLTYYENAKANAIAPKITQTAAQNLQASIKTRYLETVFSIIFDKTDEVAGKLSDGELADDVVTRLEALRDSLRAYDRSISEFTKSSKQVQDGIANTDAKLTSARAKARQSAAQARSDLADAKQSLSELDESLTATTTQLAMDINLLRDAVSQLDQPGLTEEQKKAIEEKIKDRASALGYDIDYLKNVLPADTGTYADAAKAALDSMSERLETLKENLADYDYASKLVSAIEKTNDSVKSAVSKMTADIGQTLDQLGPITASMTAMMNNIEPVLDSAGDTVTALDDTLRQMQKVIRASADDIDRIIDKVNSADENEKIRILARILGGDPEEYAEFFSSLVNIDVQRVYSVASYGAAMTPFYSVLAIWVGGVVLVAIINTHINRKKFPDATDAQAFFGRFLIFFLLGQAQAAVIVAGDIFLLHCSPVHPWLMWLTAAVASFVFTLLIYALTISFGDLGKAMVVVFMVLQIAGSSGSYPIEILPVIFGKVYKFFPFPYAINAMREAICGVYANDLWKYLSELMVFAVIALAVGLLVRKPFIGMNRFVSEKLEETELL